MRTDNGKLCCGCGQIKPFSDFYSTKRKSGIWYSGKCKPCFLEHCKNYRKSQHGKEIYKAWTKSESGKIAIEKRMNKWRNKNKVKRKAHSAVSNAIRDGKLKRQPCRICNSSNGEAHHISYDNPLGVDWLCKACHTKIHFG